MTKKDYELVAGVLWSAHTMNVCSTEALIQLFAYDFKKDNERFNEAMFRKACGVQRR